MGHTFSAAVNQRLERLGTVTFGCNGNQHCIHPATRLYAVQAADYEGKLLVKVHVQVLDAAVVRCDGDALDARLDKAGGDFGLELPNVGLAEEKLTVEV